MRPTRRQMPMLLLLCALLATASAPLRAEDQGADDPKPAPVLAEHSLSLGDPTLWTLRAQVRDRADGWPLRGATVRAWLVRPGVRTLLDEATTYDGGRALLDLSRLEHVPAALRAVSRVEVEAALAGWHIDERSRHVLPGHPPRLRVPGWPTPRERRLAATCLLSDRGAVTGRVLDAQGRPVAGAGVRLAKQGRQTATRPNGRFRIPVEEAATDRLHVAHSRLGRWASEVLQLERARDTDVGDITLAEETTHYGRVVDPTGRPVTGLAVAFGHLAAPRGRAPGAQQPHTRQARVVRATTDVSGKLALPLAKRKWNDRILFVLPEGVSSPPLRIPVTRLTEEGTYGEPWVLEHHRVRGRVALPDGTPLPSVEVQVDIAPPHAATHHITADAEGQFEVLLGPGRSATLRTHLPHTLTSQVAVGAPPTPATEDVRLVLPPITGAHGIDIEARGLDGASLGQLTCKVWDAQYRRIAVRRVDHPRDVRIPVPPGRYWVELSSEDRRAFTSDGPRWRRYRPVLASVRVRRYRRNPLRHRFEERAYLRIHPRLDKFDPRIKGYHVTVCATRVSGEASTTRWRTWWRPNSDLGLVRALPPGVYDLRLDTPRYDMAVQRITLVPGQVLDTYVDLVRTR